ncbi:hypothetical protein LDL36_11245 [Komagataeibacter sp. FNDCR1]|nr:hypothetical protein [Komagataeibacter sp. FNDCR1]
MGRGSARTPLPPWHAPWRAGRAMPRGASVDDYAMPAPFARRGAGCLRAVILSGMGLAWGHVIFMAAPMSHETWQGSRPIRAGSVTDTYRGVEQS